VFARLCEVDAAGRSLNRCDGIQRLMPGRPQAQSDGTLRVTLELSPIEMRIERGHRLRLQLSGGAMPRYSRNPGTGEPTGQARSLLASERQIFHYPAHPSALLLGYLPPAGGSA
jgi:uncharacterized protein